MNARLQALFVPGLIFAVSLAYWLQISGARRAVVLVPIGILFFIAICGAIVLVQDMISPPEPLSPDWRSVAGPLSLIALCFAYFFAFTQLGFDIANLLFVFAVSLLMRMSVLKAAVVAVLTAVVLFALATAMGFNLPDPFWAR